MKETREQHRSEQSTTLNWSLILTLATFGLLRPLLSIFGVYESVGGPWLPLLITFLIASVWVGVVVTKHVPQPVTTLVLVSGFYGVFAIVLQRLMWTFFVTNPPAALPTIGYVSIIVTNLLWGAVLGFVALVIQRFLERRGSST